MFSNCISLQSLHNINNFKNKKIIDMGLMFGGCSSLKEVDLSELNTTNVKDIEYLRKGI